MLFNEDKALEQQEPVAAEGRGRAAAKKASAAWDGLRRRGRDADPTYEPASASGRRGENPSLNKRGIHHDLAASGPPAKKARR